MLSDHGLLCAIFIDPEMQHEIDTYLSKGEAHFSVLLLVGLFLVGKSFYFKTIFSIQALLRNQEQKIFVEKRITSWNHSTCLTIILRTLSGSWYTKKVHEGLLAMLSDYLLLCFLLLFLLILIYFHNCFY